MRPILLVFVTIAAFGQINQEFSGSQRIPLRLTPGRSYGLLVSATSPVTVSLEQSGRALLGKSLYPGDLDFYTGFRQPLQGGLTLVAEAAPAAHYRVKVWNLPPGSVYETEPNDTPAQANPVNLGGTVYASGDEAPYVPQPGKRGAPYDTIPDWYRFDFAGPEPKLVFFWIDLIDRDNIPVDVSVYRLDNGQAVPYNEGEDPVALPHEVQALAGNKFTARILRGPATYLVRAAANHPEYKLRTRVYDPTPYANPAQAVRTATSFLLGAGDSWHANTPRRGGVFDRVANVHQETSLCVACHPTHFTQRAALYAARNGYPVEMRPQLQFLAERFYNNPRPFYGFEQEGAVWARMISASANVLSRMSHLLSLYESEIQLESRPQYHDGVRRYLELYYAGRNKLPPDETNGNTPLVSAYEVAWYSWEATRDPAIAALIEQDEIKNMVDLCYQTLALAAIGPGKYRDKLARNAQRILSLQRPSGQWAMQFDEKAQEAEFQTGHALWALQAAGISKDHPQVKKAIAYLLARQQEFGAWMDPLQSYENFRTPFRETQMAVLGLSAYFPQPGREKGWNSPPRAIITPAAIDTFWDKAKFDEAVRQAGRAEDLWTRTEALEVLGRTGGASDLPAAIAALGADSKILQRTAAWAVRMIYSRNTGAPSAPLLDALSSPDERTRWGATRVFASHFSALARRPEFARGLIALTRDPSPAIAMQALKALWQFWYWSPDQAVKSDIEDALLAMLGSPLHPWVDSNLRNAIYNITDENIRYFYNNWIPLLSRVEDQQRVIRGRLAVEARLGGKYARVLEQGSDQARRTLLSALVEFPLRRADAYGPKADLTAAAPPVYNRIGNDIEQIVWFGETAEKFSKALLPLLDSPDPEIRRLSTEALLMLRDPKFGTAEKAAGSTAALRAQVQARIAPRQAEFPEVWKAFQPPRPAGAATQAVRKSNLPKPDEAYFRGYVQPILEKRGKDGVACVHCHATHTLFDGTWGKALNVVDLENPENSLILRKPTSSAESEGVVGANALSHGGGVRWEKGSPEYNTILEWIRGARP
ncbi:MAG: hypothetical protein IT161_22935 [Bryobacterales bacterium]|nr:hypothetical protein [Bryobacterales bacterium]